MTVAVRFAAWSLLLAGAVAGLVSPHPATTTLWSAAARLFARAGDHGMVARLTSATKFGPRIRRNLDRRPAPPLGRLAQAA